MKKTILLPGFQVDMARPYLYVQTMDRPGKEYCGCLYYSANALARIATRIATEEFAVTGLSPSHAFLLMSVNKQPGIQPCELSQKMLLEPSTITRLLEKTESMGLLERHKDGKIVQVVPTAAGKEKNKSIQEAWAALHTRYEAILGKKQGAGLTDAIYRAVERLDG